MIDLNPTDSMIGIRRPPEVRTGGLAIICCITFGAARGLEGAA